VKPFLTLILLAPFFSSWAQFPSNYTPTYEEIISTYRRIAADNPEKARFDSIGITDSGEPLHYLVIDGRGNFEPKSARDNNQVVCLIMNGIHAGEACGINASIAFAMQKAPMPDPNVVYVIIPIYNVGGAKNRNTHSRANQVGPAEHGFRANAKNLDLNRDFTKCDAENTRSFVQLYQLWKPEVFVDTHTSNGADYQPTMTLLTAFPEKFGDMQRTFLEKEMLPRLYGGMRDRGDEMIPYVQLKGRTPEEGVESFIDYPRYGSGYTSLFNTLSFLTEAHMLKPFDRRVESTLNFFEVLDEFLIERSEIIIKIKSLADEEIASESKFTTKWQRDSQADSLIFPGFEAEKTGSLISGRDYYRYNQDKPYEKKVPHFNRIKPVYTVDLPEYYIIPQAWSDVIELLKINGVKMIEMERDTLLGVTSLYATYFETSEEPYEGHYPHYNTGVVERSELVNFSKGDFMIPTNQVANRYIAYVLEPQSFDSFFMWNFFDAVLSRKEYFSSYLFEKTAEEILQRDPTLRRSFESKKAQEPTFAEDGIAQLKYIYENSAYYEKGHLRVPVFRLE